MGTTAEPTTERLARDLAQAGAPADMVQRARDGYYDDFKSPIAFPEMQLLSDIRASGLSQQTIDELAAKVIDGEWDATPEESKAWAESPEGQATFAELTRGKEATTVKTSVQAADVVENMQQTLKLSPATRQAILAAAEMGKKTGCTEWRIRFEPKPGKEDLSDDELGPFDCTWYVEADYSHGLTPTNHLQAKGDSPIEACERFVGFLQKDATCFHCKKLIAWGRQHARELAGKGKKKTCRYRSLNGEWVPGCKV